jgi:polar amino acid transport system substrate-binding protein
MNKKIVYGLCFALIITAVFWRSAQRINVELVQQPVIVIGTNSEFKPFSFVENGTVVGFEIDVVTEVFKRLNKEITIKDVPFDALIPELQLGNIHVIAAGMTPTLERKKRVYFTNPHLKTDVLAVVSLKDRHLSIDDLNGKKVVVNEGYTADSYMSEKPNIHLIRLSSNSVSDGVMALKAGSADAFVTAVHPMRPYLEKYGADTISIIPIEGTEESSAFAISRHYPELAGQIQTVLNEMEADGTLMAIKKKWNVE